MTALFDDGAAVPAPKTQPNHVEGRAPPVCRGMEGDAPPPARAVDLIGTGVVPAPGCSRLNPPSQEKKIKSQSQGQQNPQEPHGQGPQGRSIGGIVFKEWKERERET